MWFLYVRNEDITCFGRDGCIILTEKFPLSLYNQNGKLTFEVMGVDWKNNTGSKVEIYNPEIG